MAPEEQEITLADEKIVRIATRMAKGLESVKDRNARIGKIRLLENQAKQEELQRRKDWQKRRDARIQMIPLRFDAEKNWTKAPLVQQLQRRGGKGSAALNIAALSSRIKEWDARANVELLRQECKKRNISAKGSQQVLLQRLQGFDGKIQVTPDFVNLNDESDGSSSTVGSGCKGSETSSETTSASDFEPPSKKVRK